MAQPQDPELNTVLVDNWLLELATSLLDGPSEQPSPPSEVIVPIRELPPELHWTYRQSGELNAPGWNADAEGYSAPKSVSLDECLTALFLLLDVVILHDRVVFDQGYAFTWQRSNALNPIRWLLQPHFLRADLSQAYRLSYRAGMDLRSGSDTGPDTADNTMVSEGAQFYLALAASLGLYYWPAPRRSEWIKIHACNVGSEGFVRQLSGMLDSALAAMLTDILKETGMQSSVTFSGFGAAVLSECDSLTTILRTALQVRSTKSCQAFREWLVAMDQNLQTGDLKGLAKGFSEARGVIEDAKREIGLVKSGAEPKLTLAVSPSISFSMSPTLSWLRSFRPKPYHVIFLRDHFSRLMSQRQIADKLDQMFQNDFRIISRRKGYF